jgi:beta-glucosidase
MYRKNLTAWFNGDALVQAVASQNKNTIVVVNSVGPLILEAWIEHPNVTAVVWAGLGGTETGNALVDVIYGMVNPSRRLPYTIGKSLRDYPAQLVPGGNGEEILNMTYLEGCVFCVPFFKLLPPVTVLLFRSLFVDYRHFDAADVTPRFEFGFGLSYTKFRYSSLGITPIEVVGGQDQDPDQDGQLEANWLAGKPGPRGVGSSTALWLHRPAFTVSFTVNNMGQVAGTEVRTLSLSLQIERLMLRAKQKDTSVIPSFPRWRGRAAIRPARVHRRRAAAWRAESGQCDAFEVRPVGLGRPQSVVDACLGHILSFGWREQSRF